MNIAAKQRNETNESVRQSSGPVGSALADFINEGAPKITSKQVSTAEGLRLAGYDTEKLGPIRGRVLVSVGLIKTRHYSFRRRVGDGHVLTRRGRLLGAKAVYTDGNFSHVVFEV